MSCPTYYCGVLPPAGVDAKKCPCTDLPGGLGATASAVEACPTYKCGPVPPAGVDPKKCPCTLESGGLGATASAVSSSGVVPTNFSLGGSDLKAILTQLKPVLNQQLPGLVSKTSNSDLLNALASFAQDKTFKNKPELDALVKDIVEKVVKNLKDGKLVQTKARPSESASQFGTGLLSGAATATEGLIAGSQVALTYGVAGGDQAINTLANAFDIGSTAEQAVFNNAIDPVETFGDKIASAFDAGSTAEQAVFNNAIDPVENFGNNIANAFDVGSTAEQGFFNYVVDPAKNVASAFAV